MRRAEFLNVKGAGTPAEPAGNALIIDAADTNAYHRASAIRKWY